MKFFEDIRVGESDELGRHVFTAEEIKSFAARFDPQPFHLDEDAAARSHFGRLCASGWQTACVLMRLLIDLRRREDDARRARGEAVAQLGPSPGFANCNGSSRSMSVILSRIALKSWKRGARTVVRVGA